MARKKNAPKYSRKDAESLRPLLGKTFELTCDVDNPSPDRRSPDDPRMVPVWKKGTRFRVKQWYGADLEEGVFPHLEFCGVRHARIHDIIWHAARFRALVEHAEESPERFVEFMEREEMDGRMALHLLERMEADGVTTRKFLLGLKAKLEAEWDAEYEVEQAKRAAERAAAEG